MADVFKEQLVKVKRSSKDTMLQVLLVVVAILLMAVAFLFGGMLIGPIVVIAILWGGSYLFGMLKKEYEYILTNNELDIDVIYNKERRKRIMEIDLKQISVMASIKDDRRKGELERAQKVIDLSTGELTEDTYGIVCEKDGQVVRVLVTPNADMIHLMYKQAPNKIFKLRNF